MLKNGKVIINIIGDNVTLDALTLLPINSTIKFGRRKLASSNINIAETLRKICQNTDFL